MRYEAAYVDRELNRTFKVGTVYDERFVHNQLAKRGLRAERPNGSTRVRGSRKLHVYFKKSTTLAATFTAYMPETPTKVLPVKVGFL